MSGVMEHDNYAYGGDGLPPERHMKRAGAIVSSALMAGLVWWAGALVLRDVSDVPVISAEQSEFRSVPEDPGGQVAVHTGLSVTQVASNAASDDGADDVFLAPVEAEQDLPEPGRSARVSTEDLRGDEAINAAVTEVLEGLVEEPETPSEAQVELVSASPASQITLRPRIRPASLRVVPNNRDVAAAAPAVVEETAPRQAASLSGPMVQLGAFDSHAIAENVWDQLYGRYTASLSGRPYVVAEAVVSGRTFHRLRVGGFASRSEANQFCNVMADQGVDCVPVSGG